MKLIKNFVDHLSQYTPLEEIEKSESESIFKLLYPKRLKVGLSIFITQAWAQIRDFEDTRMNSSRAS